MTYLLGVDVGSGSARCGVFDMNAALLGVGKHPIAQHRPAPDHVEQSSDDIWRAVCAAVREAVAEAGIDARAVAALSYSATCSLVLLDDAHAPLALTEGETPWNIIMWMDHRAQDETRACNETGSTVLRNLGGTMSVEMQIPKLMWVKRNRPDLWARLGYAGDLADFLCLRSTGTRERSVCTLGCKWTYDADAGGWNTGFLRQVGLEDLLRKAALPARATAIGSDVGTLSEIAAAELGLSTTCKVGMGLIDAHAGALGTSGLADTGLDTRIALIAGTSNCHIAMTRSRVDVPGVWGPYPGAVLDGWYALEGGQSTTGAALDVLLSLFGRSNADAHDEFGRDYLARLEADPCFASDMTVLPDFLGNRSPHADPTMRGAILGLTLEDATSLRTKIYGTTALGIAFGTRQIIERLRMSGLDISKIDLSGGHSKSSLFPQLYADATACDLYLPACDEPVLLGAACAAAVALGRASAFREKARSRTGRLIRPQRDTAANYDVRYRGFLAHSLDSRQSGLRQPAARTSAPPRQ